MPAKIVAIKESGTYPAVEGLLARMAEIRAIHSPEEVEKLVEGHPDVVLIDVAMPHVDAHEVLRTLHQVRTRLPLVLLFDWRQGPTQLRSQLTRLARMSLMARPPKQRYVISHIVRVLDVSQEALSRVLQVSARTLHRWLKGARPRPKPELEKLCRIVSLLEQTFPAKEAIQNYLRQPNPSFDGETPLALLLRGEFERIEGDLQAIQEGVYV